MKPGVNVQNRQSQAAAMGYPCRGRLSRAERLARRQKVLGAVAVIGNALGRTPLYDEVASTVLGRVVGRCTGAPLLVSYLSGKRRRGCRLLRAIWRKCGYEPRRGTQRGFRHPRRKKAA